MMILNSKYKLQLLQTPKKLIWIISVSFQELADQLFFSNKKENHWINNGLKPIENGCQSVPQPGRWSIPTSGCRGKLRGGTFISQGAGHIGADEHHRHGDGVGQPHQADGDGHIAAHRDREHCGEQHLQRNRDKRRK